MGFNMRFLNKEQILRNQHNISNEELLKEYREE